MAKIKDTSAMLGQQPSSTLSKEANILAVFLLEKEDIYIFKSHKYAKYTILYAVTNDVAQSVKEIQV